MKTTFAAVLLSFAPVLCAQSPEPKASTAPAPVAQNPHPGVFVLEAGEHSIQDLVDRAAMFLHRNILVSQQELQAVGSAGATVHLQETVTTDRRGSEELVANLLARAGFALIAVDVDRDIQELVYMTGPRGRLVMAQAPMRTPDEVLARPHLKTPVMTTVELKNTNATIATNALRPFFANSSGAGPGLTIGSLGNASSMLLVGMQDDVATAVRLLQKCDAAGTPPADATNLAERLQQLEARIERLEKALQANHAK